MNCIKFLVSLVKMVHLIKRIILTGTKCNYEMWTTTIALTTKESSLQDIIKCGKKVKPRGRASGRFRAERRNDVS